MWPRTAFVATVAGVGTYLATGAMFAPIFLGPALGVYAMASGTHLLADQNPGAASDPAVPPLRSWAPLIILLVPMMMAGHWREPYFGLLNPTLYAALVAVVAIAILPAMFALLYRARRENERRVREQDRRRYADEERLRIAREVHDVVGHSLSVITMQAGVALHVLDKRPEPDANGRVTRSDPPDQQGRPGRIADHDRGLPDPDGGRHLARCPAWTARRPGRALRSAGRDVRVVRDPADLEPLPAAVDQAAFRIIQEALTNVVRHAARPAPCVINRGRRS